MKQEPEFDSYSAVYEDLLRDPIRDRFAGSGAEFFHVRKRDLIRDYFRRQAVDTRKMSYLDLGCGKGELLTLLQEDFEHVCGCDPSAGMMGNSELQARGIDARVQPEHGKIPFADGQFDFVTAVCVYHHVPPQHRQDLTAEVRRVLKPNGVFAIIEHNPFNPFTRLIVSRTPVDADAVLLPPIETRGLFEGQGLTIADQRYFLYLPEGAYRKFGFLENVVSSWLPLGGQYVVFGRAPGPNSQL